MFHPRPKAAWLLLGLVVALWLAQAALAQTRTIPVGQYRLTHIDGRTDVLRAADHKFERIDGRTLATVWKRGLTSEDQPGLAKLKTKGRDPTLTLRYVREFLTRCPVLNGNGKGDFVFGLDFEPDLVAVNGASGEVLWWHRNRPRPEGPLVDGGGGFVLAEPLTHDV